VSKPLNVTAHRFSKGAKDKIEAAGGKVTLVGGPAEPATEPAAEPDNSFEA